MLNRARLLAGLLLAALVLAACDGPAFGEEAESMEAMAAADFAMAAPASIQTESGAVPTSKADGSVPIDDLGRQIIRTGRINIEVEDVDREFARVGEITVASGGFVVDSEIFAGPRDETGRSTKSESAYLRLRIPADGFDSARARIAELAETVVSQNTSSEDVTTQVTDYEARLRNLRATEGQYLTLLADAEGVEDVVLVTDRLFATRGEIERIEAQLGSLARQVELSTLVVDIQRTYDPDEDDTRGPLDAAREGWETSWQVLEAILEWSLAIIAFSWWLVPLAVLGGVIALVVNRRSAPADSGGGAETDS
ncbi:MAG: DUF4349 domain-containing protein [Chloroflexi bacterium]|nr:DUF4349 domain-containing protein [Chloroflexota bacterium]